MINGNNELFAHLKKKKFSSIKDIKHIFGFWLYEQKVFNHMNDMPHYKHSINGHSTQLIEQGIFFFSQLNMHVTKSLWS